MRVLKQLSDLQHELKLLADAQSLPYTGRTHHGTGASIPSLLIAPVSHLSSHLQQPLLLGVFRQVFSQSRVYLRGNDLYLPQVF